MAAPETTESLLGVVRKSGLIDISRLEAHLEKHPVQDDPSAAADALVRAELLTPFQARYLLQGKHKGLILGAYKVLKPLAKGGMGFVYVAEHLELRRKVALKICMIDKVGAGAVERFQREARALAAVDHPNIVRVHDCGRDDNTHFLVMEYVEGKSLDDMMRMRGRVPFREAVGYILQAAKGLQHAHERGLIHRDVKPANLILDPYGTIKLLDMGLARFFTDNEDNLTERLGSRSVLGSPDYMAPEQALNRLDIRSDIYSLGATLYALVSGRAPFPEKALSRKLLAHQIHIPTALNLLDPAIPVPLAAVVQRMLAKKPIDRYQTPAEVIDALAPWGPGGVAPAAPVVQQIAVPQPTKRPRLSRRLALSLAVVLGVGLAGLGLYCYSPFALSLVRPSPKTEQGAEQTQGNTAQANAAR